MEAWIPQLIFLFLKIVSLLIKRIFHLLGHPVSGMSEELASFRVVNCLVSVALAAATVPHWSWHKKRRQPVHFGILFDKAENMPTALLSDGESGDVRRALPPPVDEVVDWEEVLLRCNPLRLLPLRFIKSHFIGRLTTTAFVPTLQARWHHI